MAAKVGKSKGGGKQWQATPKNLPMTQCAKSHIGSITGLWFLPDRPLGLNTNECGSTVVKVLFYKSEGRWFDSSWCHWNFSMT